MPRAKQIARQTAKTTAGKRKRQTAKAAPVTDMVGIEDGLGRLQVKDQSRKRLQRRRMARTKQTAARSSGGYAPRQPLAKSVPARLALPGLAGVFPDVFVEYERDQIRGQHNMKVVGSSEDVYGTVTAANAAANA
ncbi:hypothetical protein FOA52_015789 [Chlamydomonas sp. UWO 241]|nr:hypothetical protein FOA52_015789 [Chlamydomonas sp. UWO 241]